MFGWRRSLLGLSSVCVFGLSYAAHAAEPALGAPMPSVQGCTAPIARVIAIQGEVRVRTQQQAWQPATIEQALCAGDELQVAAGGRGALRLGATTLPLDQNTHLILRGHSADGKTLQIELVSGNINVATDASSQVQIVTPHGKVSTTGGDFAVSVTAQQAALSVFGGKVAVSNPAGGLELLGDETAFFAQLSAPKRDITVKARDSVQWVVQYPALLPSGAAQPSAWAEAARQYEQGRVLDALIALDQVPAAARNADYYNYRANIFLLAGRAADAMADIEQAKKLNPDLAETWALQTIFDLGQTTARKRRACGKSHQAQPRFTRRAARAFLRLASQSPPGRCVSRSAPNGGACTRQPAGAHPRRRAPAGAWRSCCRFACCKTWRSAFPQFHRRAIHPRLCLSECRSR